MDLNHLLKRVQQMEEQALIEVHDMFFPHVYRYVQYRLQDTQDVEDISSEVFLCLLNALQRNKGPVKNLKGWIFGTANHLVQDHIRSKYRHEEEPLEDHDQIPSPGHIEKEVERKLDRREIVKAMYSLKPEYQHVLALRFTQELSIDETAQIMGKKINAVKVLQFRALAALRRNLE
jgi:RNA polymerase sigma-70 factor (ECF subfamily)